MQAQLLPSIKYHHNLNFCVYLLLQSEEFAWDLTMIRNQTTAAAAVSPTAAAAASAPPTTVVTTRTGRQATRLISSDL